MSSECSTEDTVRKIASFDDASRFHGHVCPGLTIGYIAAKAAIEKLEAERDVDEELVTIVEN
ncbi:MAG TPA: FmdE family protein, partial [Methanomethylovorans sp.]|nr:FmdE family protein [Methanomethylovorans sp.]